MNPLAGSSSARSSWSQAVVLVAVACLAVGCSKPPKVPAIEADRGAGTTPQAAAEPAAPVAPPVAACEPRIEKPIKESPFGSTEARLVIRDVSLPAVDVRFSGIAPDPRDLRPFLQVWRMDGQRLLVAGLDDREILWELDCANPAQKKVFFQESGADFVVSEMNDAKTRILFMGSTGIRLLDLAEKKSAPLTHPTELPSTCYSVANEDPEGTSSHPATDILLSLTKDRRGFVFARGGACGYEGEWEEARYVVEDFSAPEIVALPIPAVTSVAATASRLWMAARDLLWTSVDGGRTWTRVPALNEALSVGADAVFATEASPQRVVVFDDHSGSNGAMAWCGGSIAVSDDAGRTWKKISLSSAITTSLKEPLCDEMTGQGITAAAMEPDGSRLLILVASGAGFETDSLGREWKPIVEKPEEALAALKKKAAGPIGGATYLAGDDGLWVSNGPQKAPTRIFGAESLYTERQRRLVALGVTPLELTPARANKQLAEEANKRALALHLKNEWDAAIPLYKQAIDADPSFILARYNLACAYALTAKDRAALAILQELKDADCPACRQRLAKARTDKDFAGLRDHPDFVDVVGR